LHNKIYQKFNKKASLMVVNLHEELHVMQNHLHPYDNPAGATEMDPRVVLADGGEPDEKNEEEDPEELVPIDDSDDEGSGVSRVDTDPED
jgi:hypothetical protein